MLAMIAAMVAIFQSLLGQVMLVFAWLGPWWLVLLLVTSGAVGIWIRHRLKFLAGEPRGGLRVAAWVCGAVEVFAIAGLIMTFGPGKGVVSELRRLHQQVGEPVPNVVFRRVSDDADGDLAALRGQVVVLNVWATWCPPCRREMPALDALQQRYRDQGLAVVTISDEPREVLDRYFAENPVETLYVYNQLLPPSLTTTARPKTLLIDREGTLRDFVVGARNEEFFARWVEPLLG